jgi:hypothetical protein
MERVSRLGPRRGSWDLPQSLIFTFRVLSTSAVPRYPFKIPTVLTLAQTTGDHHSRFPLATQSSPTVTLWS